MPDNDDLDLGEQESQPVEERQADTMFDRMAEIKPPRVEAVSDDGVDDILDSYGGSATQRMKVSPKMSDTQVVDKRLFPILKETMEWLNNLMIARVFPETLNPLRNIIVKHLLQEYAEVSFAEAICLAEVALTVAIDGEGRMDIIHLFSKMSEVTDEANKGKLV